MRAINSEFCWGGVNIKAIPDFELPEVALWGRSNVGKSTFLNRLASRKALARTSSAPGKTREFNFYKVELEDTDAQRHRLMVIDLPGFGYAKFAKSQRESIAKNSIELLSSRSNLSLIVLLNDIRRQAQDDELAVQQIASDLNCPLLILATKSDKIKRSELKPRLAALSASYGLEPSDLVCAGQKNRS